MTGIFKANNPFNTFILFVYGLLLKLPWFLNPYTPVPQKTDGFLFIEVLSKLSYTGEKAPVIYPVLTYILLFTQAISFNSLINDHRLMNRSNYLPAMSYLLITSMFSEWNVLSAPLIINTLLISVLVRMITLYRNNSPKTTLFNIGMIVGISGFFYFPSLAFFLLIIFALIITRPLKITEWIIAFLGILTPFYFLFAYLFLSDKLRAYKVPRITVKNPLFHQNYWAFAATFLIVVAFGIGCYFLQKNFRKQLIQARKSWDLILFYLGVAFFIPFINAPHSFEYWILSAVPLSAIIAFGFFYAERKWIPPVLHWLMAACAIISYMQ